jgi:hypothetical protein
MGGWVNPDLQTRETVKIRPSVVTFLKVVGLTWCYNDGKFFHLKKGQK